jgi:hypothetical protein
MGERGRPRTPARLNLNPGQQSYAKLGRTVQTQLRLCRPAAVARQNRIAIWSCAVHGCAHAEQPVAISPLVGDSVGITRVSVVAIPLPFVLCVLISSGVGHTERTAMVSRSPLYAASGQHVGITRPSTG